MTGRLRTIGQILGVYSNDLANGTADEQGAAIVLSAIHAAIILNELPALVALIEDWYDANERAAVAKLLEEKRNSRASEIE